MTINDTELVRRLRDDIAQLGRMIAQASFAGPETGVRVKSPELLLADLREAASRLEAGKQGVDEAARECEHCIDGLQADGETPCPCQNLDRDGLWRFWNQKARKYLEERDSWRRVAERLETEKQAALSAAVLPVSAEPVRGAYTQEMSDAFTDEQYASPLPQEQPAAVKALTTLRNEVEAEHAKVSGDDGYNYVAGQEYGLRLVLLKIDAALSALSLPSPLPEGGLREEVERGDCAENTTDNPKSWIAWKRRALASESEAASYRKALEELVAAVSNMKVPQTAEEAGLQIMVTIGPALDRARSVISSSRKGGVDG